MTDVKACVHQIFSFCACYIGELGVPVKISLIPEPFPDIQCWIYGIVINILNIKLTIHLLHIRLFQAIYIYSFQNGTIKPRTDLSTNTANPVEWILQVDSINLSLIHISE